jgi:hypothetical protein
VGSQGEASALRAEGEQRTLAADEAVQEGRGQRRKDAGGAGTTGAARTSLILLSGQASTKHAELPQRKCECKPEFTFSVSLSAVWTIISSRARCNVATTCSWLRRGVWFRCERQHDWVARSLRAWRRWSARGISLAAPSIFFS